MDKMKNGAVLRNGTQRTAKEVFEKYAIVIAFLALLLVVSILCSSFLTPSNLILVLNQTSINGILAVGITYVLITAGIDISIGSVVGLSGVISAMVVKAGAPLPVGFLCGILAGTLVGVIIGILVTKGKLAPYIVTLGFLTIIRGAALLIAGGRPISSLGDAYGWIATTTCSALSPARSSFS